MSYGFCRKCGLNDRSSGVGRMPDPQRKWWQFWKSVPCDACGGDGYTKPPGWPDEAEINRLRPAPPQPEETKRPFPGGNVMFSPGAGQPAGSIIFKLADESEMVRFDPDGKVYVRGEQVDDNKGIYMHFRRWLQLATIIPPA